MGIQRALKEAGSPAYFQQVDQACEEKLRLLTGPKIKQIQDFQSRTLPPAIGARRRRGQKLNTEQGAGKAAEVLCKVQCTATDYTHPINQACDPGLLHTYVAAQSRGSRAGPRPGLWSPMPQPSG